MQINEIKKNIIKKILSSNKKFILVNNDILFFKTYILYPYPFNLDIYKLEQLYKLDSGYFRLDYFSQSQCSRILNESDILIILQSLSLLQLQYILLNSI
jgi:hypothetical protein